ncbi:MAG: CDP-diacylglycerol--glycerol-3-phosphate 3-phosphatidyltransferase, partial [Rickettsiaceae bacterium]|nr:CDP-diacylglycerol--glycerol-3-phosphate 3-phosphatidyltransferase [Rickettsiaceae bacterium]
FSHRLAALLFLIAAITDFLDGYLARKFNLQSNFGKIMDNIADKILVVSILVLLVKFRKVNEIPALLIIAREFLISGLRQILSEVNMKITVSNLGKIKTAMQMCAIFFLLLGSKGSTIVYMDLIGQILLWVSALLTLLSGYEYVKKIFCSSN